ncbi:two-component system, OmpR family, phosphate regulon sensor histidine kinase PhoR [Pedobacter insulae]|uniref:histidine kinase n=2 Tax=Pedobacter insulae TaxID=414048 RepID=A0A1I2YUW7_9SPHI|nr:two-component system, OmpR family, phosphate regulon sensor histidine kinase PhoR [Pedobacter insulae]
MTLALLGVFVMQLYYIKESYKLKSELFDQNVNAALNAVVNKVQKKNAFVHINKKGSEIQTKKEKGIKSQMDAIVAFKLKFKESENLRKFKQEQQVFNYLNFQDSAIKATFFSPVMITEGQYKLYSGPNAKSNEIGLDIQDIRDNTGKLIKRNVSPRIPRIKQDLEMGRLPDTIRYLAFNPQDFLPIFVGFPSSDPDLVAKFKLEDAKAERKYQMELSSLYADTLSLYNDESLTILQDVATEMDDPNIPLKQRIPSKEFLDTLIKKEMLNKDITLDYSYWITPVRNKKEVIYQNASHSAILPIADNAYAHSLFSNDLIRDPGMLYVSFPNKNSAILENLFATMASSVGLLLVLIFIFTYTIYAIIRQKKLSEMKTDFINNMTHEFKTPVATIMIASEALKDPDVVTDKNRIGRLAGIIYDENVRLGNHIERVLNVARLENKELKLELSPVDLNDLVSAVVDSMDLQLKKKDADVTLSLAANTAVIMGDELHLSNVIYNLIDNANKYSVNSPRISISTKNTAKQITLTITDEGIGLTKDQTKRIFDQFYRVPTGNLHDVKGFGLGLNYVQDIVGKMGGSIKVQSEKDKGTTFEITLPFKHSN